MIINENKDFKKQFYKLFNTVPDLQFQELIKHQPEYSGINITQNHLDWGLFKVNTQQMKLQKFRLKMKKENILRYLYFKCQNI